MEKYNYTIIEEWWRHLGCWDRQQASNIKFNNQSDYLNITDDWWDSLTNEEKLEMYNDFFEEY